MLREQEGTEDESGATGPAARRRAVRELVIDPLVGMGLRKPKARKADEHAAFLDRLAHRLAYLSDAALVTLAEVISRNAAGEARNLWPDEVSICNWASAIEPAPDVESRLVTSYLASGAGLRAWQEGEEVAVSLRKYLRKHGRPPVSDYDWHLIRQVAVEWRRRLARIDELAEGGRLRGEHEEFRRSWRITVDQVRALVFAKSSQGAE